MRKSIKNKSNVTAFIEVFNEEARIESCLKSLSWVDQIVVFDKESTDKTAQIAEKYATQVIRVPYTDASENFVKNITAIDSLEWVFFPTASSLIHPNLASRIIELTGNLDFEFDVIGLPYGMYSFGISSEKSPFWTQHKRTLIRRSVLTVSTQLHNEIGFDTDKIFDMPLIGNNEVLFHCTHKDADDFFERVFRYTKYEALYDKGSSDNQIFRKNFVEVFKALCHVLFRRRSFTLGWDGVALAFAYLSYFLVKFIYVWDLRRGRGCKVYSDLRKEIDSLWDIKINGS